MKILMTSLMEDKKNVDVVYFDFDKTFDCLKHRPFCCKLQGYVVHPELSDVLYIKIIMCLGLGVRNLYPVNRT